MTTDSYIFILLIVFQFKHFIADYLLQNEYMLGKFKETKWELPLAAHCGVHTLFTLIVCLFFNLGLFDVVGILAFDFSIHFIMDRIKASPNLLGKYKALTKDEFIKYKNIIVNGVAFNANRTKQRDYGAYEKYEAKLKLKGNKYFWWSLGFDQMIHHLTDILIVFMIVSWSGL